MAPGLSQLHLQIEGSNLKGVETRWPGGGGDFYKRWISETCFDSYYCPGKRKSHTCGAYGSIDQGRVHGGEGYYQF